MEIKYFGGTTASNRTCWITRISPSDDLVSSCLLCAIHAAVCSFDYGFIGISVGTVLCNTEARREPYVSPGKRNNFAFGELP